MAQEQQSQSAAPAATGAFQVKLATFGGEMRLVSDVVLGTTVGALCERMGVNTAGRQIRVDGVQVASSYVLKPTDGIVAVNPKVSAGR